MSAANFVTKHNMIRDLQSKVQLDTNPTLQCEVMTSEGTSEPTSQQFFAQPSQGSIHDIEISIQCVTCLASLTHDPFQI